TAPARYYLGQSVVIHDRPRQLANLAQSLQTHPATGDCIVVTREGSMKPRDSAQQMSPAMEREARAPRAPLLRAYRPYCPVADGIWLEIHQLYRLARQRKLHQTSINDRESGSGRSTTIEQTYVAILLLGTARPNQMRQSSMTRLYNALESWSSMASLVEPESPSALFIINPDMDCPPRYRSLVQAEDLTGSLGLDTSRLVEA